MRALLRKVGSYGQQQRAASREHNALALNRQPLLHHRLKAACSHHTLHRPAGKRKKALTGSSSKNQIAITDVFECSRSLEPQDVRSRIRNHAGPIAHNNLSALKRTLQAYESFIRPLGRILADAAPDLSAASSAFIHHADGCPVSRCCCGSCHSGWTGADHYHVETGHSDTTFMPGCTRTWQVRTCLIPSTVAQHSMQTPIAQSAFRGSPETDLRVAIPACNKAAAIVVPCVAEMGLPLTLKSTSGLADCAEVDRFIRLETTLIVIHFVYCARSAETATTHL